MKNTSSSRIVLVTAPDMATARTLANAALATHLVACANIVPQMESHYWWQGKLEASAECLILFKTLETKLSDLEQCILAEHPYKTPEFVVIPIVGGSSAYLEWLADSVI